MIMSGTYWCRAVGLRHGAFVIASAQFDLDGMYPHQIHTRGANKIRCIKLDRSSRSSDVNLPRMRLISFVRGCALGDTRHDALASRARTSLWVISPKVSVSDLGREWEVMWCCLAGAGGRHHCPLKWRFQSTSQERLRFPDHAVSRAKKNRCAGVASVVRLEDLGG